MTLYTLNEKSHNWEKMEVECEKEYLNSES